jgi:hypothetical protein
MRVNASQDYSNPYNITTSPQNCILTSVAYKNISTLYASLYVFASVFLPLRIYPITMIGVSCRLSSTSIACRMDNGLSRPSLPLALSELGWSFLLHSIFCTAMYCSQNSRKRDGYQLVELIYCSRLRWRRVGFAYHFVCSAYETWRWVVQSTHMWFMYIYDRASFTIHTYCIYCTYISISLIYPDYMRSISSHGRPFSLGFQVSQTMCCKRQSVATTAVCALPLLLKLGASGGASHGVCHRNLHYEVTRKRF